MTFQPLIVELLLMVFDQSSRPALLDVCMLESFREDARLDHA